ncbi:DUF4190 domain-containing protein [Oerskovia sp. M15]
MTTPPPSGIRHERLLRPGWQPPTPRTEPLAVVAIPTGLLLGPVGIGIGVAALARIRRDGTRGTGLAWAGIALGAAATLTAIAVTVALLLGASATRPLPADVSEPRSAHARQLVLGTCLEELPPDGAVSTVRVVPCADPHGAQVVARTDFAADAAWPGQDAADARVSRICTPRSCPTTSTRKASSCPSGRRPRTPGPAGTGPACAWRAPRRSSRVPDRLTRPVEPCCHPCTVALGSPHTVERVEGPTMSVTVELTRFRVEPGGEAALLAARRRCSPPSAPTGKGSSGRSSSACRATSGSTWSAGGPRRTSRHRGRRARTCRRSGRSSRRSRRSSAPRKAP